MKSTTIFKVAFAALVFAACSSEDTQSTADEATGNFNRDGKGLASLQAAATKKQTQTFSFDARREQVVITTESGVKININPSLLKRNGQPVSGMVNVEYQEYFDAGTMVTANKTTRAIMGPDDGTAADAASAQPSADAAPPADDVTLAPLVTGGEFFVRMSQEGQTLDDDSQYQLEVPVELTGEPDDQMIVFKGEKEDDNQNGTTEENEDVRWQKDTEQGGGNETPVWVNNNTYIMNLTGFGWSNIDRFRSEPGPKTTLYVDLPNGYDNTNTNVYLIITNDNTVAPLDTYYTSTGYFSEHYGQLPIGLQGYIAVVSESGGQWEFGYKPVTITANGIITFASTDIAITPETTIVSTLNSLL